MADCKRKTSYIDRRVQGALAKRLIAHWAIFLGVAAFFSYVFHWLHNPFQSPTQLLAGTWATHGPFLLTSVLLIPVFIYDAIKLSARFAGPIFRLRRTFQLIANDGNPRELEFRTNDFWRDMALDFNRMVNRLFERDQIVPNEVEEECVDADRQLESVR